MRKQLDKQLNKFRPLKDLEPPPMGWLKAIRRSLGLTRRQLAAKMDLSPQMIEKFEKSEVQEIITLKSLKKTAEKLNCKLLYVLIPEKPLQDLVDAQIMQKAHEVLRMIHHSMLLEQQETSPEEIEDQIKEIANEIKRKKNISMIWNT